MSGPLVGTAAGLSKAEVEKASSEFHEIAYQLSKQLGFDSTNLNDAQKARIYHYYVPVFKWIQTQLAANKGKGPLVIGISAPQGCGKSTLVEQLEQLFQWCVQVVRKKRARSRM